MVIRKTQKTTVPLYAKSVNGVERKSTTINQNIFPIIVGSL